MTETDIHQKISLTLSGVSHRYGQIEALEGIELGVDSEEVVGVVGPSGCGKSTLLAVVCGLIEPSEGTVAMQGRDRVQTRKDLCAFMPQRDLLLPWLSAIDNGGLGPRLAGASKVEARERSAAIFRRFGLGGFEGSLPHELSGGMRQRVALLRTVITDRPVLCLDEPFSALDAITRSDLQAWFAAILRETPRTCLLVTHDVEEALYLCDRVLVMSDRPGRVLREIESPEPRAPNRAEAVCRSEFVAAKQAALESLELARAAG